MFPVFLGKDTFGDWRARRIRAMLEELPQASVADFQRMQMDVRSVLAETLLPILRAVPRAEGLPAKAQALLRDWDGTMSVDAPQPLIFNAWLAAFRRNLLIGEGLDPTAGGPLGGRAPMTLGGGPAGGRAPGGPIRVAPDRVGGGPAGGAAARRR